LFVAIEVFTQFSHAVPIHNKTPSDSVDAMKEISNTIGIPKQNYHDNPGAWSSKEFIRFLTFLRLNNRNFIPPPFAERMVQTIKNMIHTPFEVLEMSKETRVTILSSVLQKYNSNQHSTINMSPSDAKGGNNNMEIWLNIRHKATFQEIPR
jgi:hypothetical protein